ncbi:MAG: hypothetical protein H6707_15015 [Deltaproteobacteria bacterium]|nr:hypothetical protein [Deltaproteobacteria bacterium]
MLSIVGVGLDERLGAQATQAIYSAQLDASIELIAAGEAALTQVEQGPVGLLLVRLSADGFNFYRAVRQLGRKDLPIVGLAESAEVAAADALRADPVGASVPLPLQEDLLLAAISALVAHSTPASAGRAVGPPASSFDFERIFRGTFDRVSVARLMVAASFQRATGTLKLTRGKVQKVVFLKDGMPIYIDSNLRHEALGAYLVKRRTIDDQQLSQALRHARNNSLKLGAALVALGLADDQTVERALAAQIQIKLVSTIRWQDGTFLFTPGDDFSERVPRSPLRLVYLVLTALGRFARVEETGLLEERALALTPCGEAERATIAEAYGEELLSHCGQGVSVAAILAGATAPASIRVQVSVLLNCGMVCYVDADPQSAVPNREAASLGAPVADPRADLSSRPLERPRYQSMIPPALPSPSTIDARAMVHESLHLPIVRMQRPSDDVGRLEQSFAELAELGQHSEVGGQAALEELVESAPITPALKLSSTTNPVIHTVSRTPPPASAELAQPARSDEELFVPLDDGATSDFEWVNDSGVVHFADEGSGPGILTTDEVVAQRGSRHGLLDEAGSGDELATGDFARASDSATTPDAPAIDGLDAELAFREGERLLRDSDPEAAEQHFSRAIELQPNQPDFYAYRAWARFVRFGRGAVGAAAARDDVARSLSIADDAATAREVAAMIAIDIGDDYAAADHLRVALAADPPAVDTFHKLRRVLLRLEAYEELERTYDSLLFRLRGGDEEQLVELWLGLAALHRDRLGNHDAAEIAMAEVARLAPMHPELRAARAAGDAASREWAAQVTACRRRLADDPSSNAALCDLFELHQSAGRTDHTFVVAALLMARAAATKQHELAYERLRPRVLLRACRPMVDFFDELRVNGDDPAVEQIVGMVSDTISKVFPVTLNDLGSAESARLDSWWEYQPFADMLRYVCEQFKQECPAVYRSTRTSSALLAPTPQAELLVGQSLLSSHDHSTIVFSLARVLSCRTQARRHIFGRRARDLKIAFRAAIATVRPQTAVSDSRTALFLDQMQADGLKPDALRPFVEALLKRDKMNLSEWSRAVWRTASRIGLLLAGDPRRPLELMSNDEQTRGALLDFSLSERFARLRRELQISVEV